MMKHLLIFIFAFNFIGSYAQDSAIDSQLTDLDFKKVEAQITILPDSGKVEGKVQYTIEVLQAVDSFYVDAQNMEFDEIQLNNRKVDSRNTGDRLWIKPKIAISGNIELNLQFEAYPEQAMYFINWDFPEKEEINRQVWTQGQGRDTSHWLPVVDDLKEKAEFDLSVDFKAGYEVVSNGKLIQTEQINNSISRWNFDMQEPMSSYLLAVAAGEFQKEEIASSSGVSISNYYEERDSAKVEASYRHTNEIFDFLEAEIGVAFPWQDYKQVPVQDFLHSGMENTGLTIFHRALLTDETGFKDRNYVNVNAHELAHQWFGNLVTQKSGEHHWLHEGFATYFALLAEKEIFGEDYYYWKLYETAERLKEVSDRGKGESLLNPKAGSLTFYQKGAWALHILRERVGDKAFKQAVKDFLELYAFQNVTTENFIAEVERVSNEDLSGFMADWLKQTAFQGTEALNSLKESEFIRNYLEIAALRETPLSQKKEVLEEALDFPVNDYIGQEVIYQVAGETSEDALQLYKKAFETNNVFIRQAIALSMDEIQQELKNEYESLLQDESWLTIEAALTNLWMQFPEDRTKYLQQTEGLEGFTDKNLRILWLTLNLATPSFQPEKQETIFQELSGYTAAHHPYEFRENAFGYLYQINAFSEQNLKDLMEGTQHHSYSFRNFCRQLLQELLKNPELREKIKTLKDGLPEKQRIFLDEKIFE